MTGGVVASLTGVQTVLEKLDAIYTNISKHDPEESRPGKRKAGEANVVEID